ncbi:hypothetical protein PVNG_06387 [Plasmodium vivax North Korean]|uniref:Uncharacterized protein n=1 Tax=Plasmodium vivax North Korean TaxID=1035514 RepID=A0A0J9W6B9_PLAVI|nr:hypothetical protein PVNG_06387 [Plasmodium vivax North Korean]
MNIINLKNKESNEFEPKCGTEIFKTYYIQWDHAIKNYLDHINKINDPVLRYISIYFVQYYIDGHKIFSNGIKRHTDGACLYLKQWLLKQKDLFTYGGLYKTKVELWKEKIPTLWKTLMKDYSTSGNNDPNSWCNYYELTQEASFPPGVNFPNFEKVISHEPRSKDSSLPSVKMESTCPPCQPPVIFAQTDQHPETYQPPQTDNPPEADRTKNLAVTSGFTAAGTLGTLFFLYRVIN